MKEQSKVTKKNRDEHFSVVAFVNIVIKHYIIIIIIIIVIIIN